MHIRLSALGFPAQDLFEKKFMPATAQPLGDSNAKTTEFKQFKARPLNKAVLESAGDLGVPRIQKRDPTKPKEFSLSSSTRTKPAATDKDQEKPLYSSFGAPVPTPRSRPTSARCPATSAKPVCTPAAPARITALAAPKPVKEPTEPTCERPLYSSFGGLPPAPKARAPIKTTPRHAAAPVPKAPEVLPTPPPPAVDDLALWDEAHEEKAWREAHAEKAWREAHFEHAWREALEENARSVATPAAAEVPAAIEAPSPAVEAASAPTEKEAPTPIVTKFIAVHRVSTPTEAELKPLSPRKAATPRGATPKATTPKATTPKPLAPATDAAFGTETLLAAVRAIRTETPRLSNKSLLAALKTCHSDWPVGAKEVRDAVRAIDANVAMTPVEASATTPEAPLIKVDDAKTPPTHEM